MDTFVVIFNVSNKKRGANWNLSASLPFFQKLKFLIKAIFFWLHCIQQAIFFCWKCFLPGFRRVCTEQMTCMRVDNCPDSERIICFSKHPFSFSLQLSVKATSLSLSGATSLRTSAFIFSALDSRFLCQSSVFIEWIVETHCDVLGILFPCIPLASEESFLPLPGKERTWSSFPY